jgi:hypothetical protein
MMFQIVLVLGLIATSVVEGFVRGTARRARSGLRLAAKKVTPNDGESMDAYRKAVLGVLNEYSSASGKFGGRELLELLVTKWGVAYDITLRKSAPFGEASGNIYLNVMWQRFGQKSFRLNEREYLEHLEAIARYIVAMKRVDHFKDKVAECRKRPNSYFGYAVGIPLDVPPETADSFFKDLPYE